MKSVANTQEFVDELFRLAEQFEGQPVAIVSTKEGLQVGVMNLANPKDKDWFYAPVPVEKLNVEPPLPVSTEQ